MAGQYLVETEQRFLVVPGVIQLDALGSAWLVPLQRASGAAHQMRREPPDS